MIRLVRIRAVVVALAAVVPIFVAGTNETHTAQRVGFNAAGKVANHAEGTVSVWNNGDGSDVIALEREGFVTFGAGKDRGWWAHNQPFDDGSKVKVIARDGRFLG